MQQKLVCCGMREKRHLFRSKDADKPLECAWLYSAPTSALNRWNQKLLQTRAGGTSMTTLALPFRNSKLASALAAYPVCCAG